MRHALDKGYHVTAYVRNKKKLAMINEKLSVVQGEIYDYEKVKSALEGQDAVIWCVGIPMKNKLVKFESQKGHEILLKAMMEKDVKRLVDWGTPMVRFMMPQDSPYTGKVKVGFGDVKMKFAISREDIGAFMVDQVENEKYIKSMPIIGS